MTNLDNHAKESESIDSSRRDFLKKSTYAAYATPALTALVMENASAAVSQNLTKAFKKCLKPTRKSVRDALKNGEITKEEALLIMGEAWSTCRDQITG